MSGKPGQKPHRPLTIPDTVGPKDNLLNLVDARSTVARIIKDTYESIVADLGGEDTLSHAVKSGALRAANLEMQVMWREARLISGELKDDDDCARVHVQLVGMLIQIYKTLGLKRVARDMGTMDVAAELAKMAKPHRGKDAAS